MPKVRVSADVLSGPAPLTVNFDGSSTTDSDGIIAHRWRWGDGSPQANTGTTATNTYTFNNPGHYQVRLAVTDSDRNRGEGFIDVYVGVTPPAGGSRPSVGYQVGTKQVTLNSSHSFDASYSFDPNNGGSIATYSWDFGDWFTCGGSGNGCFGSGISPTYTYPHVGNFGTSLRVEGASGRISTVLGREALVVNTGHAPRAVLNQPLGFTPFHGVAPFTVNFDASYSYDYDGTLSSYSWFFGDSECEENCGASTVQASYTYNDPYIYWVSLQVEDNDQNTHLSGHTVIVYPNENLKAKAMKKFLSAPADPEREALKQALSRECFKGKASACFEAGKMYEEDGDSFAAEKFFERACSLGYEEACFTRR